MSLVGVRVVRGPHWIWGSQDGEEGNIGTVCKQVDDVSKTVIVKWDKGRCNNYRCGIGHYYDLRIFNNYYLGIIHKDMCKGCKREHIVGLKYQCSDCTSYTLCASCYHNDKHDLDHQFILFVTSTANGIELISRIGPESRKVKQISGSTYYSNHLPLLGKDYETKNEENQLQNLEEATCCIGCERPSSNNVTFEPCSHKIACIDCSKKYKECALCLVPISKCVSVDSKDILNPEETRLEDLENVLQEMEYLHFCNICTEEYANILFNCGHKTCRNCSTRLTNCHMCRTIIHLRITL